MNTKATASSSGGIGFFGLLTVLFVALKLTGYITWSWWWVLVLVWAPLALVLGVLALVLVFWLIMAIFGGKSRWG